MPHIYRESGSSFVIEKAKAPRKCIGYKRGPHLIKKGERCVKEIVPDELPDCRKIFKKSNLCTACAIQLFDDKIDVLAQFKFAMCSGD